MYAFFVAAFREAAEQLKAGFPGLAWRKAPNPGSA
jgi:hypothetical protein